jgi:hypothetical protein
MASKQLADLSETVKLYRREAEVHRKQIVSLERFFDGLTQLLRKQAPEFLPTMATLGQSFQAGLAHEKLLVDAESRLAEDVNDVAARYEIVFRVTDESIDARKKVKDSRAKVESLRAALAADEAKGGLKKVKIEADIRAAIEAKRAAIEAAEAKLDELMRIRRLYNAFKIRRMRHGYQNLGQVIVNATAGILAAFGELRQAVTTARDGIDSILDTTQKLPAAGEEDEHD